MEPMFDDMEVIVPMVVVGAFILALGFTLGMAVHEWWIPCGCGEAPR